MIIHRDDNIHKSKAQEIRPTNIENYRVVIHKILQYIISEQKSYLLHQKKLKN